MTWQSIQNIESSRNPKYQNLMALVDAANTEVVFNKAGVDIRQLLVVRSVPFPCNSMRDIDEMCSSVGGRLVNGSIVEALPCKNCLKTGCLFDSVIREHPTLSEGL